VNARFSRATSGEFQVDKDRIKGSAEQVKGKIQNTIGGIKDALRGK
jgi:hypothetical protein